MMSYLNILIDYLSSITWAQIWHVVRGVAEFTGIIVAFLTLFIVLEMRRTRSLAIKPELIVLPPIYRYDLRWIPLENLAIIIRPELRKDENNRYDTRLPVFRLKNIGSAPALNIKCDWSTVGEPVEAVFMESNAFSQFSPSVRNGLFSLHQRTNEEATSSQARYCCDRESTEIPYCIASPTKEFVDALEMPSGISGSVETRFVAGDRPNTFAFLSGPALEISLEYNDVDGREHRRRFLVESKLHYITDDVASQGEVWGVDKRYRNPANIRGSIRFYVKPIKRKEKI